MDVSGCTTTVVVGTTVVVTVVVVTFVDVEGDVIITSEDDVEGDVEGVAYISGLHDKVRLKFINSCTVNSPSYLEAGHPL